MSKSHEKTIHDIVERFLQALGVSGTIAVHVQDGEATDEMQVFDVELETPDTSLVIGYHGEALEALQLLLSLAASKQLNSFVRVSLEVGEYKKNRSDYLKNLALRTKDRVLSENREVSLPELKSWERRVVHMFLQNDTEVTSESVGEGKDRVLVVKPK